jgi:hypothetical protein
MQLPGGCNRALQERGKSSAALFKNAEGGCDSPLMPVK